MNDMHPMNLCATIEARPRYVMLPCAPRHRGIAFPQNRDQEFDRRHRWSDGNRGRSGGHCLHCGGTAEDLYILFNKATNKPERGGFARLVGMAHADVPPVRFIGEVPTP